MRAVTLVVGAAVAVGATLAAVFVLWPRHAEDSVDVADVEPRDAPVVDVDSGPNECWILLPYYDHGGPAGHEPTFAFEKCVIHDIPPTPPTVRDIDGAQIAIEVMVWIKVGGVDVAVVRPPGQPRVHWNDAKRLYFRSVPRNEKQFGRAMYLRCARLAESSALAVEAERASRLVAK